MVYPGRGWPRAFKFKLARGRFFVSAFLLFKLLACQWPMILLLPAASALDLSAAPVSRRAVQLTVTVSVSTVTVAVQLRPS